MLGKGHRAEGTDPGTERNGANNTADGANALKSNTAGTQNTASGFQALLSNTDGANNTASGTNALGSNVGGGNNTASGVVALVSNTNGNSNTAIGIEALESNTIGNSNTACGASALVSNSTGSNNTALGVNAGLKLTTGSNNIDIGANVLGNASDTNTTRIGNSTQKKAFIGGISGKTVANGVGVIINANGQLGTVQSSARYKTAIKPMDEASEALLALKPVTFRYKEELDPDKIPQFGLIAEEVEKIDPDLVVRDEEGKVSAVRYEAVNAMLLNEFLKEHRKVLEQEKMIVEQRAEFESRLAREEKAIIGLTVLVRQLNDRLHCSRSGSLQLAISNNN